MSSQNENIPEQTFGEILNLLDVTIKNLLKQTDYTSKASFKDLQLIQKQTRYADDVLLHQHIVDKIVRSGIGHVFLRSWQQLVSKNYIGDEDGGDGENNDQNDNHGNNSSRGDHGGTTQNPNGSSGGVDGVSIDGTDGGCDNTEEEDDETGKENRIFVNLQYILSIIWNCTDSNSQLCESLISSSAIYQIILELSKPRLVDAKYFNLEDEHSSTPTYKRTYLMKAYLGILHNIARHCRESRKMFRSAGALRCLESLLRFPNEVVRAKTYLTLSYVVSSDEDDCSIIETADDIAAFIVALLREALGSVNHFVVRYGFWAKEIACGVNHLAINDANKVRLGKLGVIQLYATMLLHGDDEEKSLAASGTWILSFHPENKKIIRSDLTLIKTLTQIAVRSTIESVSRSLRGALWVARSIPGTLITGEENDDDEDDPSQEHIMISYHWSCQKMMIRVRDILYARGYKVWFDVDNMRGSTLEAMALAVERSAVILICMSQPYKESPNCRTEAEYAFRMRKDIIPIITQSDFSPDGWLGILAGTKLYFDFSCAAIPESMEDSFISLASSSAGDVVVGSGSVFDIQMERLVREIGSRGKKKIQFKSGDNGEYFPNCSDGGGSGGGGSGGDLVTEECIRKTQQTALEAIPVDSKGRGSNGKRMDSGISCVEVASSIISQGNARCQKCGAIISNEYLEKIPSFSFSSSTPEYEEGHAPLLLPSPTPMHSYRRHSNNSKSDTTPKYWVDIKEWLHGIGLSYLQQRFQDFSGSNLLQYKKVMVRAPEFFYNSLKELGLPLQDVLKFSAGLEKLTND